MRTLVILADSYRESACADMAREYEAGALEKNNQVKLLNLSDLTFDLTPKNSKTNLEKDLIKAQELIAWASHIVFLFPITWAGVPALLKGFIDRAFIEDFAFERDHAGTIIPLLVKKTARLIVIGEESKWSHFFSANPAVAMMKSAVLEHCGISPVSVSYFGHLEELSGEDYQATLYQVFRLALDEN